MTSKTANILVATAASVATLAATFVAKAESDATQPTQSYAYNSGVVEKDAAVPCQSSEKKGPFNLGAFFRHAFGGGESSPSTTAACAPKGSNAHINFQVR